MVTLSDMQRIFQGRILLNEPLATYTALHVGGSADYVLEPASPEEVAHVTEYFRANGFPFVLLQPNMLVSDRGFRGAAILTERTLDRSFSEKRCAPMFKPLPDHSVAALIERVGLNGLTRGGAAILADCVVNADNATASDIFALVTHVQRTIRTKLGIELELDLTLVGFEDEALANVA
jgi:UDP-N-acetylenolpyruvoylglucosamine reductase